MEQWRAQGQTLTVPHDTLNLAAQFKTQYAVSIAQSEGGRVTVSPTSPDGFYDAGSQIEAAAIPLTGYRFSGWDNTSHLSGPKATFTVERPVSVTATFRVSSCVPAVGPVRVDIPFSGGTVVINVSRPDSCGIWSVVSYHDWIISNRDMEVGSAAVQLTVHANSTGVAREAEILVAGETVTVTQAGSCPVVLNSARTDVSEGHTTGQVVVTSGPCTWTTSSDRTWLQSFPGQGTGSGTVSYTVFPNFSGAVRSGSLTIGDRTFAVTQAAGLGTPDSRFIKLLYFNYFGRLPTDAEVAFQLGSGQSRAQLAMNFLNSPEFNAAGRFVAGLYVGLLNRDAEYGGWLFQRNALAQGIVHPDSLVANFLNSEEFRLKNGVPTNDQFTLLVYMQILSRLATAAEVQWRAGLLTNGMTRVAMARDLLSSQEFREGKNARLLAFLVYATLLNRDPAQTEFLQRLDEIAANPSDETVRAIVTQIVDSTELSTQLQ